MPCSAGFEHQASGTAVLDAEARLPAVATNPTSSGRPGGAGDRAARMPAAEAVKAALDAFEATTGSQLDAGQRHLVTVFATDPRPLVVGIGAAGSGKTTAMRAYLHVLQSAGPSELHGGLQVTFLVKFAVRLRAGLPVEPSPERAVGAGGPNGGYLGGAEVGDPIAFARPARC
jgi:hypothetical protein